MIIAALLFLSTAASQVDCSQEFDRAGRAGLNACLETELRSANENLRVAWVAALERAKSEDEGKRRRAPTLYQEQFSSAAALIRAQRGWNAFRENHCTTQELSMWGGVGATSLRLGCMADQATARTGELMKYATTGQF
jgi:uncharacterized protein YecT (DUF1311 family)